VPDGVTPHAYQYPETEFRNDMEKLYSLGYRPINLSDFVHGVIDIPAGTSPFIITFDDSLPGQVDMTPDGKIDPNCAAGILSSIHAEHPDFALKGTFFILPRPGSNDYFFQAGLSNQKLQWLVQNGFELGNHTVHHQLGMNHFTDQRVQMEFAVAAKMITDVMPGYNVQTLALPYGVFPKNKKLVQEGAYNGLAYKNICALAAGAGPSPSPMSAKFNPYHIPREIPGSQPLTIRWWMNYLEHNPKEKYVSDGDPHTYTVPSDLVSKIDQAKITANGYHLRVIQPSIPTVSVATPRASTAAPKKPHK
jgi:peptidoglycan/xylan/chitin deacetylase (PgdA/CDA1 family)